LEVSPLSREVMLAYSATSIQTITVWPSLFPPSHTRKPIGTPYGLLSPWEVYGLTTFHDRIYLGGLGSASPPRAHHLR